MDKGLNDLKNKTGFRYQNFRNKLINGNFDFWQRGLENYYGSTPGIFLADRWKLISSATYNISKSPVSPGDRNLYGMKNSTQIYIESMNASSGYLTFCQYIENINSISGSYVTLSVLIKEFE